MRLSEYLYRKNFIFTSRISGLLTMIKPWIKNHSIVLIYIFTFFVVSIGIFANTGFKYMNYLLLFFGVFIATYAFLQWDKISGSRFVNAISNIIPLQNTVLLKTMLYGLLIFTIVFPFVHFSYLGYYPFLDALMSTDHYEIAFIRQNIIEHNNGLIKYLSSFTVKGLMPFMLFFFYIYKRKISYIILIVSIFYAFGLLQKANIVTIIFPLVIYLTLKGRFWQVSIYICLIILGIFFLTMTANPELRIWDQRVGKQIVKQEKQIDIMITSTHIAFDSLIYRTIITTGTASSYWFSVIPNIYPYARGCGYHFLAPILGCNYDDYDYARKIYDYFYKKEAKMGLKGTSNVASFVYDFANFGYWGLLYSAMIHACLFFLLIKIFRNNLYWTLSLNSIHVVWLSSAALTSTLFSGGWAIMVFLFLIFRNMLERAEISLQAVHQR